MSGAYQQDAERAGNGSKDPREILGVSPQASLAEIRSAYRRLAFESHPDRHPDRREEAHRRFVELGEAFAILLQEARHRGSDAPGRHEGGAPSRRRAWEPGGWDWTQAKPAAPSAEAAAAGFGADTAAASAPPARPEPLRAQRARAMALARELALRDRRALLLDVALESLAVLTGLGGVAALLWAAFSGPEAWTPPLWTGPLGVLVSAVLLAWMGAVREIRAQRYLPYAEEILQRRRGRGLGDDGRPAGVRATEV